MRRSADRRERLLAFIAPWADARPAYRGSFGFDALPLAWLTTDALEEVAGRIVTCWRQERRSHFTVLSTPADRLAA